MNVVIILRDMAKEANSWTCPWCIAEASLPLQIACNIHVTKFLFEELALNDEVLSGLFAKDLAKCTDRGKLVQHCNKAVDKADLISCSSYSALLCRIGLLLKLVKHGIALALE